MANDNSLPFLRGEMWKGGNTAVTAIPNIACIGSSFTVEDSASEVGTDHGSGCTLTLRTLANRALANITLTRQVLRASTLNSQAPFQYVNGAMTTTGGLGFLPDDRYTSGQVVAAGDVFAAVQKGPVRMRMSSRGGAVAVGDPLSVTTGSKLRKAGTNHYILAIAKQAATTENVVKLVEAVDPVKPNT